MMTPIIHTLVSNADVVPCGKKGIKIQSLQVPLLKEKYLSEFRTELEKAKVRANLGIADAYNLDWANIKGFVETNELLVQFIKNEWKYTYSSPYIPSTITTVKDALDYALHYVSTYVANDELVLDLKDKYDKTLQEISELESNLNDKIGLLGEDLLNTNKDIEDINNDISDINNAIDTINKAIETINVDANIKAWITAILDNSKTIEVVDDTSLEVKVSLTSDNSISIKNDGLYAKDFSGLFSDLSEKVDTNTSAIEGVNDALKEVEKGVKYVPELPEDTVSPDYPDITVKDLKDKNLSQIIDTLFFPAAVRDLVVPTLIYQPLANTIVKVGSEIVRPRFTYVLGDAGELKEAISTNLYFNNVETEDIGYNNVGIYTFKTIAKYKAGEKLINNRGEVTDKQIPEGLLEISLNIIATYPWYAGNSETVTELDLVPFGENTEAEVALDLRGCIKLPGINSELKSFEVNTGLGYLPVNMVGWKQTTQLINGITYKVWTKDDEYFKILTHKLTFKLAL